MAGSNKILKNGEVLFKAGEASDGMYIIRKGELEVFLEENGKQVSLAKVAEGSMIGEMALFDRQPRSASVRAVQATEVTQITNDDFAKLMKQIPKWFVSLMATLSNRLRTTNERLQKLESVKNGGAPFSRVTRLLQMINLIMQTKGIKDKRLWVLNRSETVELLKSVLPELAVEVDKIVLDLTKAGLFETVKDSYNNTAIGLRNKGDIDRFSQTLGFWLKQNGSSHLFLPNDGLQMLETLGELLSQAVYDSATISTDELELAGKKKGLKTETWKGYITLFKGADCPIKLVKMDSGNIGLKADKKEFPHYLQNLSIITWLGSNSYA